MPKLEYFLLDMGQSPPTSQAETTVSAVVHFENYTSGKVRIMVCNGMKCNCLIPQYVYFF